MNKVVKKIFGHKWRLPPDLTDRRMNRTIYQLFLASSANPRESQKESARWTLELDRTGEKPSDWKRSDAIKLIRQFVKPEDVGLVEHKLDKSALEEITFPVRSGCAADLLGLEKRELYQLMEHVDAVKEGLVPVKGFSVTSPTGRGQYLWNRSDVEKWHDLLSSGYFDGFNR